MDLTAENSSDTTSSAVLGAAELPGAGGHREYFEFKGLGAEYFRIWAVNLLLTLLTLGIYAPWAKVRRNRYIYGNLQLADSHFDYLARPLVILRGRLVALALLLAILSVQWLFPPLILLSIVLLGAVTPWLIVRARMFNMRYTAYRNIRFAFRPVYWEAYKAIYVWGFLSFITLGLALPHAHYRRNSLLVGNTRFGNLGFALGSVSGKFYWAYFLTLCFTLVMVPSLVGLLEPELAAGIAGAEEDAALQSYLATFSALSAVFLYFVVGKFLVAYTLRITTDNTTIGEQGTGAAHRLGCDWSMAGMLWIYVSNMLAILVSVGLLIPWAQMRILRYQLNHTWLESNASLEDVLAEQTQKISSLGEEIGEVFDIEIGL